MWLHPVSVKKNVQTYISPKLCLTPEIKSKYFRTGECVGMGQTTVGDFSRERFCPSWKIYRRDFFHFVIISTLQKKKHGRNMSTNTKMDRGDFVREGFCPAPNTDITRSCPASQIFVPEILVSLSTRPK